MKNNPSQRPKKFDMLYGTMRTKGITIEALAFETGISTDGLSKKINGHRDFTRTDIAKICRVLSLSTSQIGSVFFGDIPA